MTIHRKKHTEEAQDSKICLKFASGDLKKKKKVFNYYCSVWKCHQNSKAKAEPQLHSTVLTLFIYAPINLIIKMNH